MNSSGPYFWALVEPATKEAAIQYVIDNFSAEALREMHEHIQTEGPEWYVERQFGLGLGIRNLLREGGFKDRLPDLNALWHIIVEAAAQRAAET